jgi:hypothetical protein
MTEEYEEMMKIAEDIAMDINNTVQRGATEAAGGASPNTRRGGANSAIVMGVDKTQQIIKEVISYFFKN